MVWLRQFKRGYSPDDIWNAALANHVDQSELHCLPIHRSERRSFHHDAHGGSANVAPSSESGPQVEVIDELQNFKIVCVAEQLAKENELLRAQLEVAGACECGEDDLCAIAIERNAYKAKWELLSAENAQLSASTDSLLEALSEQQVT